MSLEYLASEPLFPGISTWAIGVIAISYFVGFFVRGAFGFGSNIPIVLLTTPILGPHHAIVLATVTSFIAQIDLLPQGVRTADRRVSKPLIVGMLASTGVGTWLLTLWRAEWLEVTMGVLIMVIAGLVTLNIVVEALLLIPPIFLGTFVGTRFFRTASPERFWAALQGLLMCGALVLVGKDLVKGR